jgi:hypothetical protein
MSNELSRRLNEYRKGRPVTILHAALNARGYSYSLETVRRWFRGESQIPLCVLMPLARELRLTTEELHDLLALAARVEL